MPRAQYSIVYVICYTLHIIYTHVVYAADMQYIYNTPKAHKISQQRGWAIGESPLLRMPAGTEGFLHVIGTIAYLNNTVAETRLAS